MKKLLLISFISAIFICSPAHANGGMKTIYQAADVLTLPIGMSSTYEGAATLFRKKNELKANLMSLVPTSGIPVTAWFIVFNKPNKCDEENVVTGPDGEVITKCDSGDIGNPDTQTAVYYAGSAISADDGMGYGVVNIHAKTAAGQIPEGIHINKGLGKKGNVGLKRGNGFKAEVHFAFVFHTSPGNSMSWITDLTSDHDGSTGLLPPPAGTAPAIPASHAVVFVPVK